MTPEEYYELNGISDPAKADGPVYHRGIIQSDKLTYPDPTIGVDKFPGTPLSQIPICSECNGRGLAHHHNCRILKGANA